MPSLLDKNWLRNRGYAVPNGPGMSRLKRIPGGVWNKVYLSQAGVSIVSEAVLALTRGCFPDYTVIGLAESP